MSLLSLVALLVTARAMRSAGFRSTLLSAYTDVYLIFIFSILLLNPVLRMSLNCAFRALFLNLSVDRQALWLVLVVR